MSIKNKQGSIDWINWEKGLKFREIASINKFMSQNIDELDFWSFVQYEFFTQWKMLKTYANNKGVKIIGDMPIYVAYDSSLGDS